MRVAILSDIHDHVWNLAAALEAVRDTEALICCGDLCSPFIVGQLAEGFAGPVHIVFGNNDGDLFRITDRARRRDSVYVHGAFWEGELGGKRFMVNHYPELALAIAASGKYDVVCYGHNHAYHIEPQGQTLTINPGALMGFDPISWRDVAPTFVIYDTQTGQAQGFEVIAEEADGPGQRSVRPYS